MTLNEVELAKEARPAQVGRQAMSAEVVEYVRKLIFNGSLSAGQRVPQDLIAERLGVSRLPVREALIALENEGLVESQPHRGVFIAPISRIDIEDHYRVYGMIQGLAAVRAVDALDADDMELLEKLHFDMSQNPTMEVTVDLNWKFHSLITRRGGSRKTKFILRQMAHNFPRELYEFQTTSPEANEGHARILAALKAGDRSEIEHANRDHMIAEGAYVLDLLEQRGVLSD